MVRMMRQTDPRLVDILINHPDIRPTIEDGDHALYSEKVVSNPANVVFADATGVILFINKGNGLYVGHIAFLPEARGKVALKGCASALDRLFGAHGAVAVEAAVPLRLRAARVLVRRLGFASLGRDDSKPVEYFKLEAEKWAAL